ncbi:hypothetical protein Tco_1343282 [Tanacetum coccineum]
MKSHSTTTLLQRLCKLVQRLSQVLEHPFCLPLVNRHFCMNGKIPTIRPKGNLSARCLQERVGLSCRVSFALRSSQVDQEPKHQSKDISLNWEVR